MNQRVMGATAVFVSGYGRCFSQSCVNCIIYVAGTQRWYHIQNRKIVGMVKRL
jgi:hypothetical protein